MNKDFKENKDINELEALLAYFKETDNPHSTYANTLLKNFVTGLDLDIKKQINDIVKFLNNKNSKYYKNYNIESFIKAYIFNKNNGRKVGSLTDYIQHYKKRYTI